MSVTIYRFFKNGFVYLAWLTSVCVCVCVYIYIYILHIYDIYKLYDIYIIMYIYIYIIYIYIYVYIYEKENMKSFSNVQWNTKFFLQKVLFLLHFGSSKNCIRSANLLADIRQKLCNKRRVSSLRDSSLLLWVGSLVTLHTLCSTI